MQYYYNQNGQQHGPFTLEEFQRQPITKDTLVWKPGMAEWVSAGSMPDLMAMFPPPIPMALPATPAANRRLELSTKIWKWAAIGTFLIMVGVAYWKFGQSTDTQNSASIVSPPGPVVNQDSLDQVEREREAQRIEEELKRKEGMQKAVELLNWRDLVTAKIVNVNVKNGFGGINSVTIDITNNLSYDIEWMDVWIEYVKLNGDVYTTQSIDVRDLKAGEFRRLTGPGAERGRSARCRVQFIVVPALGLEIIPADT